MTQFTHCRIATASLALQTPVRGRELLRGSRRLDILRGRRHDTTGRRLDREADAVASRANPDSTLSSLQEAVPLNDGPVYALFG